MSTKDDVIQQLDRIEPRLDDFAHSAPPDTIAICAEIISQDTNPLRRANAAILAALVNPQLSLDVLDKVLRDSESIVRIAGARALGLLATSVLSSRLDLVEKSLTDSDAGVRKYAISAVRVHRLTSLRSIMESMIQKDPLPFIRSFAADAIKTF